MRKADNLPPYCAVVKKSRSLNFLDPSGPAQPVTGVLFFNWCLWFREGGRHQCPFPQPMYIQTYQVVVKMMTAAGGAKRGLKSHSNS